MKRHVAVAVSGTILTEGLFTAGLVVGGITVKELLYVLAYLAAVNTLVMGFALWVTEEKK